MTCAGIVHSSWCAGGQEDSGEDGLEIGIVGNDPLRHKSCQLDPSCMWQPCLVVRFHCTSEDPGILKIYLWWWGMPEK